MRLLFNAEFVHTCVHVREWVRQSCKHACFICTYEVTGMDASACVPAGVYMRMCRDQVYSAWHSASKSSRCLVEQTSCSMRMHCSNRGSARPICTFETQDVSTTSRLGKASTRGTGCTGAAMGRGWSRRATSTARHGQDVTAGCGSMRPLAMPQCLGRTNQSLPMRHVCMCM